MNGLIKRETFTAIDFETANGDRSSICQVGLIRVVSGIVVAQINLLVQPPENYYWNSFVDIHGITPKHTECAPAFALIWPVIESLIEDQDVVAHNSRFDFDCLQKTLAFYGISEPKYRGHCTYQIYRRSLKSLCNQYEIELNHHDALSDASA